MWACVPVPAPTDSASHPPGLPQARSQHSPESKQPSPAWSTEGEKASVLGPSPYLPHRGILRFHPRACGPNRTQNLGRQQIVSKLGAAWSCFLLLTCLFKGQWGCHSFWIAFCPVFCPLCPRPPDAASWPVRAGESWDLCSIPSPHLYWPCLLLSLKWAFLQSIQ